MAYWMMRPVIANKNISYVFMRDNHTTPEVAEFLQEESIQVMTWPACPPKCPESNVYVPGNGVVVVTFSSLVATAEGLLLDR